ncbi:alkaline phosphatase family protein [Prolixibacter sp. NT017]|uniref:alkaline phosphatase family protein n=1 Tax=Prolixibacter sp. NT017 TaxID=2652390 RepID=UPI0012710831|nr:alkaline phosphatase family protein [Prolixibacter sp. NT017]GET23884.1 alkaline phosphatase family protein [Prolixibacter sp. NT017]
MYTKRFAIFLLGILSPVLLHAQSHANGKTYRPKLVVGIVVEDIRPDYIDRYWDKFRTDGFRRLVNQGFVCRNNHIDNLIQRPSVGMATLFTGAAPSLNGIVNDQWIDRLKKKVINCTHDDYYTTVGSNSAQGDRSAMKLMTPTIGDALKIMTNGKAKVYSVALNAPAAIFSAGHSGDGAYWFDTESGNMISSSYYVENFPDWAFNFNSQKLADDYLSRKWETLYPISNYTESIPDNYILEPGYYDKWNTFPYDLSKIQKRSGDYRVLKTTPFGNLMVSDFATSLIANEGLGQDSVPDMLTVTFSSMDYERNSFGPASVEMEDTYLRMDQNIAHLLNYLDRTVGKDNVVVFLTGTSSASYPSSYLKEEFHMQAGTFNPEGAVALLKAYLNIKYGQGNYVETYMNQQVYFDRDLISERNIDLAAMQKDAATFLNQFQGVASCRAASDLESVNLLGSAFAPFQNSYNPKRSGDVLLRFEEGWQPKEKYRRIDYTENSQVPLIFWGGHVKHGTLNQRTNIMDVVPTLADFLGIMPPNAARGSIINVRK